MEQKDEQFNYCTKGVVRHGLSSACTSALLLFACKNMENYKKTDALVSFVAECCYQFGKENKLDSFDFFQEIAGVAHDVFTKTESVPEYLFATDLLTLFCQLHIGVMQGTMTEKELKECWS